VRGEFLSVWRFTLQEIWEPLSEPFYTTEEKGWNVVNAEGEEEWEDEMPEAHEDLFCELFRTINSALREPYDVATKLTDIVDDTKKAREAFWVLTEKDFKSESALRLFFEAVYTILNEVYESKNLRDKYISLLRGFIEKYSLRYAMRDPLILVPTLPGIFSSLLREFQLNVSKNVNLEELSDDFEDALKAFRLEQSTRTLKECIRLQFNLLEGYSKTHSTSNKGKNFGKIAQTSIPHRGLSKAVDAIYEFANDYPGIRHSGAPENKNRELELRDFLVISLQLYSCLPYLSESINPERIYGGSINE
jgi:hypothetical protein